ncbi:hypothetical protein U9M48_032191, partial [Paspalum notatum var. saurae]
KYDVDSGRSQRSWGSYLGFMSKNISAGFFSQHRPSLYQDAHWRSTPIPDEMIMVLCI